MQPPWDFQKSLEKSHSVSNMPFWEECYRKFFKDMVCMVDHRQDGDHQRAGIDRSIIFHSSKRILVDEKARFKDYGKDDILLEEWSSKGKPGWCVKPLQSDYIAYAIVPTGKCYLLPVIQMQAAFQKHKDDWREKYKECRAPNNGYVTISIPVPIVVLWPAMGNMLRCDFKPPKPEEMDSDCTVQPYKHFDLLDGCS